MAGNSDLTGTPAYSQLATRLLQTNSPPSTSEEAEIRACIEAETANLDTLEREIEQLQVKRERIVNFLQAHRSILSPHRRLRVEILGEIVSLACDAEQPRFICVNDVGKNLGAAPWKFTYVSSRWRSVTIGLGRLWTEISLERLDPRPAYMNTVLCTILNRSQDMPLTIRCAVDNESDPRLLDNILSVSSQWKTAVTLSIPTSFLPRLQQLKNSVPLLEFFRLHIMDVARNVAAKPTVNGDWLVDAPKLYSLSFDECSLGRADTFPIPWGQLTEFDCWSGHPLSLELERLAQLTSLETYYVGPWGNNPILEGHALLTLHNIQHLGIGIDSSPQLTSVLRAPNLQTLTWRPSMDVLRDGMNTALQQLLSTSSNMLKYIHISLGDEDWQNDTFWPGVMDVLSECSHTVDFGLSVKMSYMGSLVNSILPSLILQHRYSPDILPALQSIHISLDDYGWDDEDDAMPEFAAGLLALIKLLLASRRTHLRSFTLISCREHVEELMSVFTCDVIEQVQQQYVETDFVVDLGR